MSQDIICYTNLDDVEEITQNDYTRALCYSREFVLMYSETYSAYIVDINKEKLNAFIENILKNSECQFDYIIEDFSYRTGVATFIYKNNFIYYTRYDDVFSNPYDFVKIKIDDIILNRLRHLSNYK